MHLSAVSLIDKSTALYLYLFIERVHFLDLEHP